MDSIQCSVISVQLPIESSLAEFCLPFTDYCPDEQEGKYENNGRSYHSCCRG
jgi:hypothetical protein